MKFQCKCGETVIDSEATQKYCWMTASERMTLWDTIDFEIEKIRDPSMHDAAIMHIRDAAMFGQVWECSNCKRLITLCDGEVTYFHRE